MEMEEEKEKRITAANQLISQITEISSAIRMTDVREQCRQIIPALRDLRDTQYLFDSGEKELIRLYERYMPYYMEILENYLKLQESANREAIIANGKKLIETTKQLEDVIRNVIKILPQDEIDEANAKARAEELKRSLEEQRRNVVK